MSLLAQAPTWTQLESAGDGPGDVATIGSLTSLITNLIRSIVALSGVVLLVMLLAGGISFLFSGGDQKKLEKAKGTLTAAFMGLLILVGSFLILKFIQTFTGVNITTFSILN